MKTVFTTGEAAKICKVSQQTIIRCFDNGQLKGFRVPGSRFRRIPREMLYKFMKDNGIPTDALESGKRKVLLVDDDTELVELMTNVLEEDGRFEVRVATTGFAAGMKVKEYRSHRRCRRAAAYGRLTTDSRGMHWAKRPPVCPGCVPAPARCWRWPARPPPGPGKRCVRTRAASCSWSAGPRLPRPHSSPPSPAT